MGYVATHRQVREPAYLDCPCCGDEGAVSWRKNGMFHEGQRLICGCDGSVSIDDDPCSDAFEEIGFAYVSVWDCDCWKRRDHNTRSRRRPPEAKG